MTPQQLLDRIAIRRSDVQTERAEALRTLESDDVAAVTPPAEFAPGPKGRTIRADAIRGEAVAFGEQQDANGGDQYEQEKLVGDPAFADQASAEDQYRQNRDDVDALIQEAEHKWNWNLQLNLASKRCSHHRNRPRRHQREHEEHQDRPKQISVHVSTTLDGTSRMSLRPR